MMSRLTGGIGGRGPGETKLEINRRRARERIHRLEKRDRRASASSARSGARERTAARPARSSPSSATPTPASRRCSTRSPAATCSSRTSCSPRSIRPRGGCASRASARSSSPTPSASSAICRRIWSRAFRATLEELDEADLLLHVVDAADPAREQQIAAVETILGELGLGRDAAPAGAQQDRPRPRGGAHAAAARRARPSGRADLGARSGHRGPAAWNRWRSRSGARGAWRGPS